MAIGLIPYTNLKEIVPSAARTASGRITTDVDELSDFNSATIYLNVTALATDGTDLLDIIVQRVLSDNATYDTIGRFPQIAGDGSADKYVLDISNGASDNTGRAVDDSITSPVLAAGSVRDVGFGEKISIYWIVTSGNSASFTFDIGATFRA